MLQALPFLRLLLLCALLAPTAHATTYYISPTGNDANDGLSPATAWRTFAKINNSYVGGPAPFIQAGDRILIEAGSTLTLTDGLKLWQGMGGPDWVMGNADDAPTGNVLGGPGDPANPIVISTYPLDGAPATLTVSSISSYGFDLYNIQGVEIRNLSLTGPGNQTSTKIGIFFYDDDVFGPTDATARHIEIRNVSVSQFRQGALIQTNDHRPLSRVRVEDSTFHANADNGLSTYAQIGQKPITDLAIRRVVAHGNVGRSGLTTPTGSGIVLSGATGGLIEHCIAYNNGINNTNFAGPVGIWMYECADSVIQFCESYDNKTSAGDGGGFDIDGGCTNSVIQYCYSHNNDGADYLMAQYQGATPFSGNVIPYNISRNDSRRNSYGGLMVWGHTSTGVGVNNSAFYGNTVYMTARSGFTVRGLRAFDNFTNIKVFNNLYHLASGTPAFVQQSTTYTTLAAWRTATGNERLNSTDYGLFADPLLYSPATAGVIGDTTRLDTLTHFRPRPGSPAFTAGLAPATVYGYTAPTRDYYGDPVASGTPAALGAAEPLTNLVANPGFESGVTSWDDWGNSVASASAAFVGSQGLRTGTAAGGRCQDITGLVPGQTYHLHAFARLSATGALGWVGLTFQHASGPDTVISFELTSTAWTPYARTFTAPAAFTRAYVWVWKEAGTNTLDLDEVALATVTAPATYDHWRSATIPLSILSPAQQLPTADPDADGLPNLLEYAFGTLPDSAASRPNLESQISNLRLQISFPRARPELTYEVLASNDLATWSVIATNPGTLGQQVTFTDPATLDMQYPRRFLRLRVTQP